ncbi:MAG: GNAT family N-acetyltransferase, partial [Myxococcales bacterium]|nr:GNAT family N-acetyltransferase [Myxococcales bacterium]
MELRAITDGEIAAFRHALITTFGGDPAHDPDGDERFRALIPAGRAFAAFDRGAVVATAASFAMSLTVPGGATLPMAGLTMVTVRPTHRRRGVLRRLIATHLADARAHGDPVSGLWASEASIYGRFGYGLAAEADELAFVATDHVVAADRTPDQLDDVDAITADDAAVLLPPVYDAVRRTRPAMYARSRAWWKHRRFADRPDLRGSNSPRRHAVTLRAGAVTGYVVYRQRLAWDAGVAAGKLEIEELLATDARAEATLWRFVAGIDLFPNVAWWNAPVDSPLPWLVADARRLRRRRTDTLWLRVEDVAATLAARTYAADGVVRVAVTD